MSIQAPPKRVQLRSYYGTLLYVRRRYEEWGAVIGLNARGYMIHLDLDQLRQLRDCLSEMITEQEREAMIKLVWQPLDMGEDGRAWRPLPVVFTAESDARAASAAINMNSEEYVTQVWLCESGTEWADVQQQLIREGALRKLSRTERIALGLPADLP